MKVWVTKYALTSGIQEHDVEDDGGNMVRVRGAQCAQYFHGEGREWHRTCEGAIAKAREMRDAKIAALARQMEKLRAMDWPAREAASDER